MKNFLKSKFLLKISCFVVATTFTFLFFSNDGILVSNNLANLVEAMNQERSITANFNYTQVNNKSNMPVPYISRFNNFSWARIVGSTNLYPYVYTKMIEYNNSSLFFRNFNNDWEGSWANWGNYGKPGEFHNNSYINNWMSITQYNRSTGANMVSYIPRYIYSREVAHNTLFGKTQSYIMNVQNGYSLNTSDPIVVMMSKKIQWNNGGWNVTNPERAQIVHASGTNSYDTSYSKDGEPIMSLWNTNDSPGSPNAKQIYWFSAIFAMSQGSTGDLNIYYPQGSTTYNFTNLENQTMPPTSDRQNVVATTWLQKLMSDKTKLVDFTFSNGVPSTYYDISANAVADNLKGTITITISPGVCFTRKQMITANNTYNSINNRYYEFVAEKTKPTVFVISGFKQVKPTKLITNIDVNNPYIQPQYVTYDEIKKIILNKGISGDLPEGFNEDNIVISNIQRFNISGSINVNVSLSLYYDNNGDIKTTGFSSQLVTIKGWATTNASTLPSTIVVNRNILPTDLSANQIQEIIYNYIVENKQIWVPGEKTGNFIFPPNFSKGDIIIKNARILADNTVGTVRVDVNAKNFYDADGQVTNFESTIGRVTIRGLKSVSPTVLGSDTYDFIDPTNSLYPSDVLALPMYLKNFIGSQIPSFMKPDNFVDERDIVLTNMEANNQSGVLIATVSLINYYDGNGIPRQTGFKPRTIIFNFAKSIHETFLPDEINVQDTYGEVKAHTINEEQIKQIICDNFIQGKPDEFTTNNIKFKNEPRWDSSRGRIFVTPILNYWVDDLGNFRTDPHEFPEITIYNFLGSPATRFNNTALETAGSADWVPTSIVREPDKLKDIIFRNVIGRPDGFSVDNIEFSNVICDNTSGSLTLTVNLNYYNDSNGNPCFQGFTPVEITIGGFQISQMPTMINTYISGDPNKLAQNYTHVELKKIILENTDYAVNDYNLTNIDLKDIKIDYINGRISLIPVLNLWYGNDLAIHTESKDFPIVTIGDLKTVQPTYINTNNLNLGINDMLPSEYAEEYEENLINLVDTLIMNKPDDFDKNNDIILSNIKPNDLEGKIELTIELTSYYNEVGILKNSEFKPQTIVITGYDRINGETSIAESIEIKGYEDKYPFEITTTEVRQMIFDNLRNKVPNMTIHNVTLYNSFDVNNFNGSITTTPFLDCYYNQNGEIIEKSIQLNTVTFFGFNHAPGATSLSKNGWVGNPNILAENVVKDIYGLKDLVFKNIINPTPTFDKYSQIEFENLTYDNILGIVSFNVILKEVFDTNGEIVSGKYDMGSVTINGYKTSLGYTTIPTRIETKNKDKYASELNEEDIKKIILENVKNAPDELTINDISIKNNQLSIDNKQGTIKFIPVLNWTYDVYGSLSNIPKEFDEVTIYNFKKASETIIPISIISAKQYPILNNGNMFPNELSDNLNLLKQITMELIDKNTTPPNFGLDNIQISNINADNYTGSINFDVSLNYYFDKNGVIQTNNFNPITITIVDMSIISGVTSILQIININGISKTPSEVSDDEIKQIILNNTFYLPPNFSINDISFKIPPNKNNIDGTITVVPILSKSYSSSTNLITTPVEFREIKIKGFQVTSKTILKNNIININQQILPSDLANDTNTLKQSVMEQLAFLPPLFDLDNIDINQNSIIADNLEGKLYFSFTLNKYYDAKGLIQTDNFDPIWITINNLSITSATNLTTTQITIPGLQSILPSKYSDNSIINYVKSNLTTTIFNEIPTDIFDWDQDLIININEKNNLNGTINIEIGLKKYYNNSGVVVVANNDQEIKYFNLQLNGFNSISETTINDKYKLLDQNDVLSQNIINNPSLLLSIVYNNINSIVNNLPSNFTLGDIVINNSSIKSYDNVLGTIDVEIGIKNYYNQNGDYVYVKNDNDPKVLKKIVTLSGFKTTTGTTIIPNYQVSGYSQNNANEISESILASIVSNNASRIFSSLPSINSLDGNLEINILTYDNEKGTVTASVKIYEYYNENGDKITRLDNSPLVQNVLFSGFNIILPTKINDRLTLKNQIDNLASAIDSVKLKSLLYPEVDNLFDNLPNDFNFENHAKIEIISSDNLYGEIMAQITLNYYINDQGIIVDANNDRDALIKTVFIDGFKKVKQTSINQIVTLPNVKNINPLSVTDEQLFKFVAANNSLFFNNLPLNFNNDQLTVKILSANSRNGSIQAMISISDYYDENENLVVNGNLTKEVTIYGFKSFLSSNSGITTIITIGVIAAVLTAVFISVLAISFRINRKRLKI